MTIVVERSPGGDYLAKGMDAAWITDVCDVPTERGQCRFPASQLDRVRRKLSDAGQELEVCGPDSRNIPARQCVMSFTGPIVKKAAVPVSEPAECVAAIDQSEVPF